MAVDLQSVLAVVIVVVTTGIVLYFALTKKDSDCSGGCGCSTLPKKFPPSQKK